jgi:hypothetical protein
MGWNPNTEVDTDQTSSTSHLFLVRLWLEDLGAEQREWRGRVQHVLSGQVRYFREWAALETILKNMVSLLLNEEAAAANDQDTSGPTTRDKSAL